ncbi:MAG TPA: retropepsin-like aspartic protease, partial [Rhizomicrobium sp.]
MSISTRFAFAAAVLFAAVPLARADQCHLARVASLDMTMWHGGLIIPTSIKGATKSMLVDTGAPLSSMDPQAVQDLQLATHTIRRNAMFDSDGREFREEAIIPTLQIGDMQATDVPVLVEPSRLSEDDTVAGLLGEDFLRHYEIELDFAAHKLNLLSQDHCPGQVIYWKADAVAV